MKEVKEMSKKGNNKSRSEKHLANVLLATAIIELLIKILDFLEKVFS